MTTRPFHPYQNLDGILHCSHCGDLFLKGSKVRGVAKRVRRLLKQNKTLTFFPGETNSKQERDRRWQHGMKHVENGEARLTPEGRFVLAPAALGSGALPLVESEPATFASLGFTIEES